VFQLEGDLRRIPLSRGSHITGFQPLPTGAVEHESALERDFVTLTSFTDPGATITSQPVTMQFDHQGERRKYTPDFLVRWSDGHGDLVEIKYWADLREQWPRLRPAFVEARNWARRNDACFIIVTERRIRGQRLKTAKRLLPLRTAQMDPVLAELAVTTATRIASPTFGTLVAALPASREAALAVVWRLLARGRLCIDDAAPITPTSRVWAA